MALYMGDRWLLLNDVANCGEKGVSGLFSERLFSNWTDSAFVTFPVDPKSAS